MFFQAVAMSTFPPVKVDCYFFVSSLK
jgi:hypothetical protein